MEDLSKGQEVAESNYHIGLEITANLMFDIALPGKVSHISLPICSPPLWFLVMLLDALLSL